VDGSDLHPVPEGQRGEALIEVWEEGAGALVTHKCQENGAVGWQRIVFTYGQQSVDQAVEAVCQWLVDDVPEELVTETDQGTQLDPAVQRLKPRVHSGQGRSDQVPVS